MIAHVESGAYYGYPECCVKSFINDIYTGNIGQHREVRKLSGTGYIPCAECNKLSEQELKNKIAKNRVCEKTFPRDEYSGKIFARVNGVLVEVIDKIPEGATHLVEMVMD